VDWPEWLSVGEYMLRGEKIVRKDGKYEMEIQRNGNLVIKSRQEPSPSPSEVAAGAADTQVLNTMISDVDSLWLHRFQLAVYKSNQRVKVMHCFYDESPEYRLMIDQGDPADYTIQVVGKANHD
jgi:hypothetical protein